MVPDAVPERKLLIELITSYLGKIISPCVKEHGVYETLGALYRKRLAGTYFSV